MRLIADLHIHSPYSRATSKDMGPENLALWAILKGVDVLGTGDILHPKWFSLLKEQLIEKEGLFSLKNSNLEDICAHFGIKNPPTQRFLLSGEISCIYKQDGKVRKVHHLILFPNFQEAEDFSERIKEVGNIDSDGRPILGIDSHTLLSLLLEEAPGSILIPAHVWTPWFSLFGAHSGFDLVQDCFKDLSDKVTALETGLSSDPAMNRLISKLDGLQLVSNSDAHSLRKIGREATVFEVEPTFEAIKNAISTGRGLLYTIEFFPEEGKYHLDGHRACGMRLTPEETTRYRGICPVCGKPVTKGVLSRVRELSDRKEPLLKTPYKSLIPLEEILAEINETSPNSKVVQDQYLKLINTLGPEIPLLLEVPLEEIEKKGHRLLRIAIQRMREGKVRLEAGYDGQYGRVYLFEKEELKSLKGRAQLFFVKEVVPDEKGPKEGINQKIQEATPETHLSASISPNPEQLIAIEAPLGNYLIQAGPGTGKTYTLVRRIAFLSQIGTDPEEILCLTFTRRAKREIETRLRALINPIPNVMTFHGLCLTLLREFGHLLGLGPDFVLMEQKELYNIPAYITKKEPSEVLHCDESHMELITRAIMPPNILISDYIEEVCLSLLRNSSKTLEDRLKKYKHIFIDEFQDTNPTELSLLSELLKITSAHIWAIGDPNQAIYGFRGIEPEIFTKFSKLIDKYQTISLKTNYRSTGNIVKAANSIINTSNIVAIYDQGRKIEYKKFSDPKQEAQWISNQIQNIMGGIRLEDVVGDREPSNIGFSDIAILYRLNEIGTLLEKELSSVGIPCLRIISRRFVDLYPVNLVYTRIKEILLQNSPDSVILEKQEKPVELLVKEILSKEGFKEEGPTKHLIRLAQDAGTDLKGFWATLLYEDAMASKEEIGDKVMLMSIHASKGLEWDVVFLVGLEEEVFPLSFFGNTDMEEEKRLFYVAVTRAKKALYMSSCRQREINKRWQLLKPSSFVSLLPPEVVISSEEKKVKRLVKKPLFWGMR